MSWTKEIALNGDVHIRVLVPADPDPEEFHLLVDYGKHGTLIALSREEAFDLRQKLQAWVDHGG